MLETMNGNVHDIDKEETDLSTAFVNSINSPLIRFHNSNTFSTVLLYVCRAVVTITTINTSIIKPHFMFLHIYVQFPNPFIHALLLSLWHTSLPSIFYFTPLPSPLC